MWEEDPGHIKRRRLDKVILILLLYTYYIFRLRLTWPMMGAHRRGSAFAPLDFELVKFHHLKINKVSCS